MIRAFVSPEFSFSPVWRPWPLFSHCLYDAYRLRPTFQGCFSPARVPFGSHETPVSKSESQFAAVDGLVCPVRVTGSLKLPGVEACFWLFVGLRFCVLCFPFLVPVFIRHL